MVRVFLYYPSLRYNNFFTGKEVLTLHQFPNLRLCSNGPKLRTETVNDTH